MFFAVLNRSSSLPLALAALCCFSFTDKHIDWRDKLLALIKRQRVILFLPLAAGVIAFVGVRLNANVSGFYGEEFHGGNSFSLLFFNLSRIYEISLLAYVQNIGMAYGPLIVFLIWQWRLIIEFLSQRWDWWLIIIIFLVYGTFATTHRFLIFITPIYLVLLGIVCERKMAVLKDKKILLLIIILAQAVSQRLFWQIPADIPNEPQLIPPDAPVALPVLFTPFSDNFIWYDIFPEYNRGMYGFIVTFQYIIFIAISLFFLTDFFGLKKAWQKNKRNR